jgi:hypothetical protein
MRINNASGLPEIIYKWLQQDMYDGAGDSISATTLLKPAQEYWLTQRYWNDIEVDAIDRIWSLFGQGVHAVLEKLEGEELQEERLFAEIEGAKISGKFDLIHNNKLIDWKTTSSFTIIYNSREQEWKKQLSIYRWLFKKARKITLDSEATIVAILRDWSASNVSRIKNYPKLPIMEIPIELLSLKDTEKLITNKIELFRQYEDTPDGQLLECTPEEMWYNAKKDEYMRCQKYCACNKFCQQKKRRENGTDIPSL